MSGNAAAPLPRHAAFFSLSLSRALTWHVVCVARLSAHRVLLRYPLSRRGNAAFFSASLGAHMTTLLTTPAQTLHVAYLPVYTPSAKEEGDAELYAEQVRRAMAKEPREAKVPASSLTKQLRTKPDRYTAKSRTRASYNGPTTKKQFC